MSNPRGCSRWQSPGLQSTTRRVEAVSARHGISNVPAMILFRGGREVARESGAMPRRAIVDWGRSSVG